MTKIMELRGIKLLKDFMKKHADAREPILAWVKEAEEAVWKGTCDIKERHRTASILGNNIVIFNIKGNSYRLVIKVAFAMGIATVLYIGVNGKIKVYQFWE